MHFFNHLLLSFPNTWPVLVLRCNTATVSSSPSLSFSLYLNSVQGNLSVNFTLHIHLNILISHDKFPVVPNELLICTDIQLDRHNWHMQVTLP